jgi:hypothetical protein
MAANRDRRAGPVPQRLGAERIGRSCSLRVGIWRWTPSSTAWLPGGADHCEPRRRAYPLTSLEAQRIGRSERHPPWEFVAGSQLPRRRLATPPRRQGRGCWHWASGPGAWALASRAGQCGQWWRDFGLCRDIKRQTAVHRPPSVSLVTSQISTDKPRKRGTVKMGAAQRLRLHAHIRRVLGSGGGSAPPGVRSSSPGSGRRRPRLGSPCRRPPDLARRWRRR